MQPDDLHPTAASFASTLPGAVLEHPFGAEHEVYKVGGKIFMLLNSPKSKNLVTLKSDPEIAEELRRAYSEITPGYHLNKRHWISIQSGDKTTADLLHNLITDSYLLVVEKLPRNRRPVDPFNFEASKD